MWCCSEGNFWSSHSRSDTILSGSRDLTSAINTRTTLDAHSHKLTTTLPHIISYFQSSPHTQTHTDTDGHTHTQREKERVREREAYNNSNKRTKIKLWSIIRLESQTAIFSLFNCSLSSHEPHQNYSTQFLRNYQFLILLFCFYLICFIIIL